MRHCRLIEADSNRSFIEAIDRFLERNPKAKIISHSAVCISMLEGQIKVRYSCLIEY